MTLVDAAHARIENAQAELQSAKAFLRFVDIPPMLPDAKAVMEFVAARYNLEVCELVGNGRSAYLSKARGLAMYLMRSVHGIQHQSIAYYFNRDRSTVEQALQTVSDRRDTEKKYRLELSALVTAYAPPGSTS